MDNKKIKNKELILATHNDGKIKEFQDLMYKENVKILDLKKYKIEDEPVENGSTFSENAQIKLEYYFSKLKDLMFSDKSNIYLLSEDSGIEIDFLDGKPGIKSARYGGNITTTERNKMILKSLSGVDFEKRKARYVSCIKILNFNDEIIFEFIGYCEGHISNESLGKDGFGYDPIFIPLGYNKTMSLLGDKVKNDISHRSIATKKMIEKIFKNER